ncbi:MAG: protein-L-isoaspartate(D-aspartate) O-methyltransferase [Thiogranum sp.]|nr:protein-L-isoaspartate(D-aspartate) O-methyltransferase [Thiogranum sp.]
MKAQVRRMIADIESEVRYTRNAIGKDRLSADVMRVMAEVPRDAFVPDALKSMAFENGPLPIGHDQTISQPYIVALMTDLLQLDKDDVVLEIGTGSGYQAAILSRLCKKVYSVEYVPELSHAAALRLQQLGYDNIEVRAGSGYGGWAEHAPYDAIIVTAAATHIPEALLQQLKPGGRLVIPVGGPYSYQELVLVTRDEQGKTHSRNILGVAFVPLRESATPYDSETAG